MENIELRFTIKEDLNQLPWLYRQYHNGDTKVKTNQKGMLKKFEELSSNKDYKFVSAVVGDKLVGFCSVVVNHDIVEQQKPILMLWNLRVHPDYRRKKIGKRILEFIENFGKSIDAYLVFLGCDKDNDSARKFYTQIGYGEDYAFYKWIR